MALSIKGVNVLSRIIAGLSPPSLFPGGSLSFNGSDNALSVASSADWNIGTGDFTIQWFHRQVASSGGAGRIFQFGGHPSQFGTSFEGGSKDQFYLWLGGSSPANFTITGTLLGVWHHIAITRQGTQLRMFQDGTLKTTVTNSTNPTLTGLPLILGKDPNAGGNTHFNGQITNFEYVVGTALYTAGFTPPTTPLDPASGSKLLLRATSSGTYLADSSGLDKTVSASGTAPSWSALNPFAA